MNQDQKNEMLQWTECIQKVCGDFETTFDKHGNLFIGEVKSFLLGETEVAFIKSNASHISRKSGMPDRVQGRLCFLLIQYTGKMRIAYKDQSIQLNEGDVALLDPDETIDMYPQGLFSHVSVHLSREKLFRQGITVDHFGKLITSNMSGHLLKCMLQNLSPEKIELWYAKEDENAFEDALIALIKPTINYKNVEIADHLKIKAERFIFEHLSKQSLNAAMIADHLGISLRQLHRLFEHQQQSVHQFIQTHRIKKIQYELKDNKNKSLSITEIALKWGFGDSAHFSKLFRKMIGLTPKQYRLKI
ncbi:hypothetical protein F889_01996 [Acinetobacter colistiniresistens]|uniref:HTH araC/xylS-type domain-containing protein n=2 Tax=Acinetobacter colistiniresistens TaxID=280145 RepID=N9R6C1_9GAMM|nr:MULTISPECIES: transcriptional regulator FeaR [Acinetobacter]ENX17834.1 hypothetical protein F895_00557 [Acinetobacter sp. CIP 64.2]ENX34707.1 hypothetical protein F889_01996 [Acinetobacter colistiniresistens]